jgi:hypothetical protein
VFEWDLSRRPVRVHEEAYGAALLSHGVIGLVNRRRETTIGTRAGERLVNDGAVATDPVNP